jgi:hypothetical protein
MEGAFLCYGIAEDHSKGDRRKYGRPNHLSRRRERKKLPREIDRKMEQNRRQNTAGAFRKFPKDYAERRGGEGKAQRMSSPDFFRGLSVIENRSHDQPDSGAYAGPKNIQG